ncbi:MAG: hypothetical protein GXY44_13455 [Phycisphaerales bacterium]|nr:hypothetical protein [Phycisphaerales bacterium]
MRSHLFLVMLSMVLLAGCENNEGLSMPGKARDSGEKSAAASAEKTATASEETIQKARTMIDETSAAIQDNKLERAEDLLGKLKGMQSSLPESMQDQIASLQRSYDTAKAAKGAAGGLKVPGG